MRTLTKFFVSLFFLLSFVAKAQWTPVSVGTTSNLSCVDYTSAQQIIIGGAGTTVISSDGGATWLQQPLIDTFGNSISGSHVYDLYPLNSQDVVAAGQMYLGNNQVMIRSLTNTADWFNSYINNNGSSPKLFWDIDFVSGLVGYAAGTHGRILKTINGGLSWTLQATPTTAELYGIDFVNATTGVAVGDNRILRTTDGGVTWTAQTTSWFLRSIHFPTPTVGYASGSNGVMLKSTDAGATWNLLPVSNLVTGLFNEVWFTAQDTGYAVAGNLIFKTVDGGQIWTYTAFPFGTTFRSIHFLNPGNGFAVGASGVVYRTTNGGGSSPGHPVAGFTTSVVQSCGSTVLNATNGSGAGFTYQWLFNSTPYSSNYNISNTYTVTTTTTITLIISNACCSDTVSRVVTVPVQSPISTTANADQTFCGSPVQLTATGTGTFSWLPALGLNNPGISNPLASPGSTTNYTVTLTNALCTATDQVLVTVLPTVTAQTWYPDTMPIYPGSYATAVYFIDANHGFTMQSGGVHKTVNGGATWTNSLLTGMGVTRGCINFPDYNNGWIATGNTLRQTADAGVTWTVNIMPGISFPTGYSLEDVFFTSSSTGYVLINDFTSNARIGKTVNGGVTWTGCHSGLNERLTSIYGLGDTLYCIGNALSPSTGTRVYKSVDAGVTWSTVPFSAPAGTTMNEVEFLNSNYGFIMGTNYAFQTSDGGGSWTTYDLPNAQSIEIINHDTIYVGGGSHIYKTFSAGACWADMGSVTPNNVFDLSFPKRQNIKGYFATADNFTAQRCVVRKTVLTGAHSLAFSFINDTICSGQSFTAYNGSVGYSSYQWFANNLPVATTQDYVGSLAAGTYQIKLVGTYATGNDTLSHTLIVMVASSVVFSGSTSICLGGTATISASGANSYSWQPGNLSGPTITINPSATTTYTLTATSLYGCTYVLNQTLTVMQPPQLTASSFYTCDASPVTLTANNSAIASSYTWLPVNVTTTGNSYNINPTATTTYTVVANNAAGACSLSSGGVIVQAYATPSISAFVSQDSICSGSNTIVSATGAPLSYNYTWYPGALSNNTLTVSPSASTTYTVIGTSYGYCPDTATVFVYVDAVNPTTLSVPSNVQVCAGSTVTITASGASSYSWQPGNLTGPSITVPSGPTTIYTVTGTNTTGCTFPSSLNVNLTILSAPALTASSPSQACLGGFVNFNAFAPGTNTYLWQPGNLSGAVQVFPLTGPTTLTVTCTNILGCSSTAQTTTLVSPTLPVTGNIIPSTSCVNDPQQLLSGFSPAGGSFSGMGVINGNTFDPYNLTPGPVYIDYAYTNSNGCISIMTDTIFLFPSNPASLSLVDTIVCYTPQTFILAGGSPTGGIYSGPGVSGGIFNPMATPGAGVYPITYVLGSCSSVVDSITVVICIGGNENDQQSTLDIYPNPSSGIYQLNNRSDKQLTYEVVNVNGRLVLSGILNRKEITEINLSDSSAGVYFLRIMDPEKAVSYKLIKL
ncbi:MAG: YCF48-related protein [Bacteroidota bacterium]|nr:YCF48-related protein [Bacteroidota bacterium]